MKMWHHRGISDDDLDQALAASDRHAAFTDSPPGNDQIQSELAGIIVRATELRLSRQLRPGWKDRYVVHPRKVALDAIADSLDAIADFSLRRFPYGPIVNDEWDDEWLLHSGSWMFLAGVAVRRWKRELGQSLRGAPGEAFSHQRAEQETS